MPVPGVTVSGRVQTGRRWGRSRQKSSGGDRHDRGSAHGGHAKRPVHRTQAGQGPGVRRESEPHRSGAVFGRRRDPRPDTGTEGGSLREVNSPQGGLRSDAASVRSFPVGLRAPVDRRARYGSRVTPVAPRPLHEIVEPGWAKALEPVTGRVAEMGTSCARRSPRGAPIYRRDRMSSEPSNNPSTTSAS